MPETTIPTAADLADYLAFSLANYPTDQLQDIYDAALDEQFERCITDPYTSSLAEALMRRGQRIAAARGAALGVMDLGEYGSQPLLRWDSIIDSLEMPYRKGGFG